MLFCVVANIQLCFSTTAYCVLSSCQQTSLSCQRYSGHVVKAQGASMVAYAGEPGYIAVKSPIPHNTTSVTTLAIQFTPMRTVLHINSISIQKNQNIKRAEQLTAYAMFPVLCPYYLMHILVMVPTSVAVGS